MNRLKKAEEELAIIYDSFNEGLEKKLPALVLSEPESMDKLLTIVIRRESMAVLKKVKYQTKQSTELRRLLADVLLLNDDVDVKKIKANSKQISLENN